MNNGGPSLAARARRETVSALLERLDQLTHRRPPEPPIQYHAQEGPINESAVRERQAGTDRDVT